MVAFFLIRTTLLIFEIKKTGFKPYAGGIILWVFISIA